MLFASDGFNAPKGEAEFDKEANPEAAKADEEVWGLSVGFSTGLGFSKAPNTGFEVL